MHLFFPKNSDFMIFSLPNLACRTNLQFNIYRKMDATRCASSVMLGTTHSGQAGVSRLLPSRPIAFNKSFWAPLFSNLCSYAFVKTRTFAVACSRGRCRPIGLFQQLRRYCWRSSSLSRTPSYAHARKLARFSDSISIKMFSLLQCP